MKKNVDINRKTKPMSKVNLDAFIPRADFVEQTGNSTQNDHITDINLSHLIKDGISSLYNLFRKPDFQRETNEWDKLKICNLIDSFMKKNFVPAVILWKNPSGYIIVIDGAHRLSALIAYINDDYGDKKISQEYFDYNIQEEEKELAEECRKYINDKIGSFKKVQEIYTTPSAFSQEEVRRANNFKTLVLKVQMINNATAKDAEDSFFIINQQGVALSTTEKKLCKSRKYANAIATRAIIKGGVGHQYWGNFKTDNQDRLKIISKEINGLMFKPPLLNASKSGEFYPMGGRVTAAMPMVFDFINIVNKVETSNKNKKEDLFSGDETVNYLIQSSKIVALINSNNPGSLGLYPLAFFYTGTGAHIPTAFLSLAQLLMEYDQKKAFPKFTVVRASFENFIIKYRKFVPQIIRKYGSKQKSEKQLTEFYKTVLNKIESMANFETWDVFNDELNIDQETELINTLLSKFNFLTPLETEFGEPEKGKDFSKDIRNARNIIDDLANCKKCKICGGRIQSIAISIDHMNDKKYEGDNSIYNSATTHKYCNTGFKNYLQSLGIEVKYKL